MAYGDDEVSTLPPPPRFRRDGSWEYRGLDWGPDAGWWMDGERAPDYLQDQGPLTPLPPPWDPDGPMLPELGILGRGTGADDPWYAAPDVRLDGGDDGRRAGDVEDPARRVRGDDVRGGPGSILGIRLPNLGPLLWLVLLVALVLVGLWLSNRFK